VDLYNKVSLFYLLISVLWSWKYFIRVRLRGAVNPNYGSGSRFGSYFNICHINIKVLWKEIKRIEKILAFFRNHAFLSTKFLQMFSKKVGSGAVIHSYGDGSGRQFNLRSPDSGSATLFSLCSFPWACVQDSIFFVFAYNPYAFFKNLSPSLRRKLLIWSGESKLPN
jgi:hypothetical protein